MLAEVLFSNQEPSFPLLPFEVLSPALRDVMTKFPKFCLRLSGNVYIQPTQDTKNPVIYGVFSVSG